MDEEYKKTIQSNVVQELSAAMVKAAGEVMTNYGQDPDSPALLIAAICMMIEQIGIHVNPFVPEAVKIILNNR